MTFHPIIITEYYNIKADRNAISPGLFLCDFSDIFDEFALFLLFEPLRIPLFPVKIQLARQPKRRRNQHSIRTKGFRSHIQRRQIELIHCSQEAYLSAKLPFPAHGKQRIFRSIPADSRLISNDRDAKTGQQHHPCHSTGTHRGCPSVPQLDSVREGSFSFRFSSLSHPLSPLIYWPFSSTARALASSSAEYFASSKVFP